MARHFDSGSLDYIDCGTGVRGSDVQKITVGAWINLDDHASEHTVMGRWNNTTSETWLLTITPAGKVNFVILATDNNAYGSLSSTVLTPGTWYHIAGTYDGATVTAYVNGAAENPNTVNKTMKTGTLAMLIGQHANSAYMNGSIAEATIWLDVDNAALMIAALAQRAAASDLEGMSTHDHIGYWPLLGTSPEWDATENNHPGTLHGTTVVDHPGTRSVTAFRGT